jgi:hypothetical protein
MSFKGSDPLIERIIIESMCRIVAILGKAAVILRAIRAIVITPLCNVPPHNLRFRFAFRHPYVQYVFKVFFGLSGDLVVRTKGDFMQQFVVIIDTGLRYRFKEF